MAGDSAAADAAHYPIQGIRGNDVGRGGSEDGAEGDGGQCKEGISEIYGRKIKFVPFVPNVPFLSAIV